MVKEAISLLEFSKLELVRFIENEVEKNPFFKLKGQLELFPSSYSSPRGGEGRVRGNPHRGRGFTVKGWGEGIWNNGYDVLVKKKNGELKVFLEQEGIPEISFARDPEGSSNQLREALWLIKSLKRRKEILLKVSSAIFDFQKDFFVGGELKPFTMTDLARITGLSVSAISRVTRNKRVLTPHGVFSLRDFFKKDGSIKELIKEIKEKEGKISDRQLNEILQKRGYFIARRTVAKYRKEMFRNQLSVISDQ